MEYTSNILEIGSLIKLEDGLTVDKITNNVGIGTTAPLSNLHITTTAQTSVPSAGTGAVKGLYVSNDLTTYGMMIGSISNGNGYIQQQRTDTATYYNLLLQPNGGSVGIGTTSPGARLQIGSYMQMDSSANYPGVIGFNRNINTGAILNGSYGAYQLQNQSGEFQFQVYNSAGSQVTIHRLLNNGNVSFAGNVGIGTTAPSTQLNVMTATNAVDVLRLDNSGGSSGSVQGVTHLAINHFGAGTNPSTRITAYQDGVSGWPGGMYFSTRSLNTDSAPVERMRITSAGNVGIGTTAPSYKLDVNGTFRSNAFFTLSNGVSYWGPNGVEYGYLTWDTGYAKIGASGSNTLYLGGGNQITILNGGNVGIGTTAPGAKLEVNGTIVAGTYNNTRAEITSNGNVQEFYGTEANPRWAISRDLVGGGQAGIGFNNTVGTINVTGSAIGGSLVRALGFYTSNGTSLVERMRITSAGNVGINTTSPQYLLDVNGDAQINASGTGPAYAYQPDGGFGVDSLVTSSVENVALGKPDVWLRIHVDGVAFVFPGYQE